MGASLAYRNAIADAFNTLVNAGAGPATLKLYTGSMPAAVEDAPTGTLLATLTFNDPYAPAAAAGVLTADVTPAVTTTAAASGTVGYGRFATSAGTGVYDATPGQLGLSGAATVTGQPVTLTGATVTAPAA